MQIPAILYGKYREVKPKCRKIITRLKRGESWEEIFAGQEYLDSNDYSSSLIMDGPCPNNGSQPFFHCYVLHREFALSPLCTRYLADHQIICIILP